ncbi:MAG: signal peptidase I [Ruminococcaceae bacterium]|nr:signal peptidase I [Oscillospiraceae bacterium]
MLKLISKILKIASYCLFGLIVSMSLFVVTLRFLGESPSIFGYSFYYVLTESMEPEIMAGEMIIGKSADPKDLKVGDIITYIGESDSLKDKIITHKIVEIDGDSFTTQGVANDLPDPPIDSSRILSRYVTTIPLAGKIFTIINSRFGFIFLIAIPLCVLIVNEISTIVKAFKEDKEEHLSE